ncbi:MAG: hypothetical protein AB7O98_13300 [Hyphomonadaceae bacterium]
MRVTSGLTTAVMALAITGLAWAQIPVVSSGVTSAEYVDAHRPQTARRSLTSAERAQARGLIREIETAATPELLDQLRPIANAGDRNAMIAMMLAYDRGASASPMPIDGLLSNVNTPLAGLWAAQLWQSGYQDREVSRVLSNCEGPWRRLQGERFRIVGRSNFRDCGFDFEYTGDASGFSDHWTRRGPAPGNVVFTERALSGPDIDQRRFETVISAIRTNREVLRIDRAWAEAWSRREGGARAELFANTVVLVEQERAQAESARLAAATAARARHTAQWNALYAQQQNAGTLSDTERADWAFTSAVLGGNYLEIYARFYPLVRTWEVEEVCGVNPSGNACQRQTELQGYIASGSPPPSLSSASGNVSVRVYDQGGNYQGNTNMPSWALSFIGSH